jgi:lysophospholipase L1-like esterase
VTRRLAGALVVAFAAVAVVGCTGDSRDGAITTTTTSSTAPTVRRVLVIGDSNLFQASPEVDAALRAAGFEPTEHGVPGYGLKDLIAWLDVLPSLLEPDPDVVVVGLGTNDTTRPANIEQFPARLDRMMKELGGRPVIWITHVDDRPGAPAGAGSAINAAVRAAPVRWPNLTILDFAVDIANDPTIIRADRLHFSEGGRRIYAERIATAVGALTRVSGRG